MTNPIIKKLSSSNLTRQDVADLLEKHIGPSNNEEHCKAAFEALSRIKDLDTNGLSKGTANFVLYPNKESYCQAIRNVIKVLRNTN